MKSKKWIVHPHSYGERGRREISVIHETFGHGLKSCGWFNQDKKLIAQDSMYGNMDDGACKLLIEYAENMAKELNTNNVKPSEAMLKEESRLSRQSESMGLQFKKSFESELYKALTNNPDDCPCEKRYYD